jgi:hypothetical protein
MSDRSDIGFAIRNSEHTQGCAAEYDQRMSKAGGPCQKIYRRTSKFGINQLARGCCDEMPFDHRVGKRLGTLEMAGLGFPDHFYNAILGS